MIPERFLDKIIPEPMSGCWLWIGAITTGKDGGYASAGVGGRTVRVHRWLYELLLGPVRDGLPLDHQCNTRSCVNPDHLRPATHTENILRGTSFSAVNARKTHCPYGHPFEGDNLRLRTSGKGRRICRRCAINDNLKCQKIRRARQKAERAAYIEAQQG